MQNFNVRGVTIQTSSGNLTLVAGQNISIQPTANSAIISAQIPNNLVINSQTPWQPPMLPDVKAPNNSVYYSTTAAALVYKSSTGTVTPLT